MNRTTRVAAVCCLLQLFSVAVFTQVEKFDIVSYTTPKGWDIKKGADAVLFTTEDKSGAFCIVTLYKSVDAGTDSRANFDAAWNALVNGTLRANAKPQIGPAGNKDGWTAEVGLASVNTAELKGAALLTTMTGGNRMLNVLVLTNSDAFDKEIESLVDSIKLPTIKPVAAQTSAAVTPVSGEVSRLIGKWNRSSSGAQPTYADPASWGTAGYTTSRYEFKADGTYVYTERSFRMTMQSIIIVKENGKYTVNGNTLSITPQKSTIASYNKAGGTDTLGTLIKSQNRDLEQVAYKFNFHYFEGIQEWNLVLQADKTTQRDGSFSNNKTFPNAWYFDQRFTDNDLTAPRAH